MIQLIKTYIETYIETLRILIIDWLDLENSVARRYEELLSQQRQHITYLSQRVHALSKPIVEAQSNNIHFPSLDELLYEYKTFKQKIYIKESDVTIQLNIKGHGLDTDYRYVDQANHRLYMKIVSEQNESVWYNCCEKIQAIGLVEKNGCYCVQNDKRNKSTAYQRICFIPGTEVNGNCTIFLRFGKVKDLDINCESIKVF